MRSGAGAVGPLVAAAVLFAAAAVDFGAPEAAADLDPDEGADVDVEELAAPPDDPGEAPAALLGDVSVASTPVSPPAEDDDVTACAALPGPVPPEARVATTQTRPTRATTATTITAVRRIQ